MRLLYPVQRPKILVLNFEWDSVELLASKGYDVEDGYTEITSYSVSAQPVVAKRTKHYYPSPPYEYDMVIFNSNQKLAERAKYRMPSDSEQNLHKDIEQLCAKMNEGGFVLAFVGIDGEPEKVLQYAGLSGVRTFAVDPRAKMLWTRDSDEGSEVASILRKYSSLLILPVRRGIRLAKPDISLIVNNADQTLGACIYRYKRVLFNESVKQLRAIILPQFQSNVRIAVELLGYVERAREDLFPSEGYEWLEQEEYKFEEIAKIEEQIAELETDFAAKKEHLEEHKAEVQKSLQYLNLLLIADDSDEFKEDAQLTPSVKKVMEEDLGFPQVEWVDKRLKRGTLKEDLLIRDEDYIARVECKGTINPNPSRDCFGQLANHLRLGQRKIDGHQVRGLLVVNHHRRYPAFKRQPPYSDPDGEKLLKEYEDFGLLWTVQLYRIAMAVRAGSLPPEKARQLIKEPGRIVLPNGG